MTIDETGFRRKIGGDDMAVDETGTNLVNQAAQTCWSSMCAGSHGPGYRAQQLADLGSQKGT